MRLSCFAIVPLACCISLSAQPATSCPVALTEAELEPHQPSPTDSAPHPTLHVKYTNQSDEAIRWIDAELRGVRLLPSFLGSPVPDRTSTRFLLEGLGGGETLTSSAEVSISGLPDSGAIIVRAVLFASGKEWHAPDMRCGIALKGRPHLPIGLHSDFALPKRP